MNTRHSGLKPYLLVLALLLVPGAVQALPEIPFCPLGGPTGWWNRLTDDDDDRYYPPPFYPPPQFRPYWNQAYPYGYVPQYPSYPVYPVR
jgi:hypothetical protein